MNNDIEVLTRDIEALENCKTEGELHYAVRNIEARHAVEHIGPADKEAWENVKRQHIARIYRTLAA